MDKFVSQTEQLSPRELEIAEGYSGGESYNDIAQRLCIAPSTVRTHLTTIYRKLGVSSKLELHKHLENSAQPIADSIAELPVPPDKPSIAVLPPPATKY